MMSSQAIACETFGLENCGGLTHALGDKYKGEFANGRPNGIGEIEFGKDKTRKATPTEVHLSMECFTERAFIFSGMVTAEGEWVAGVRHGQGQLFTAEGRYKQTFEYGIMVSNAPVKTNKSQSDHAQNQAR